MNTYRLKVLLLLSTVCFYGSLGEVRAQEPLLFGGTPELALKANVLSYASTTLHLGGELKLSPEYTLDLSLQYNPWEFSENKKMKHFLVQPEIRYWLCEAFNGTFLGLHAHYGKFNVGGIGLSDFMKKHRHEGWLAGAGVSIGYQWIVSRRWSLEASLGVGYAYLEYGRYPCQKCAEKLKDDSRHYVGPTKAAVSLVYVIK